MKKALLLLGILVSSHFGLRAQIDVVDNQTAQALAQTLVGQGVVLLNPVLNCTGIANGKFRLVGGTTNLGIDSGIVLTSGRAMTVGSNEGVNGPNTAAGPSQANGAPGDPDLNTVLAGLLSKDRCNLEFDFVPAGDTVKFDYVFGSTEYQSFSCSGYNDIFGFFISGPGYATPRNIALIPGTNIPICVNSTTGVTTGPLCTGMGPGSPFTAYYIPNVGGATVTYFGFTTIYTAIASVIPCDTFHLKLAIADGSSGGFDDILDSGVFLKAGSLNSTGIVLTPESTNGGDDTLAHCIRGCKSGFIKFARPSVRPTPLTVKYLISGTAVNGVDYETIADSVVIPANQISTELEIKPKLTLTPTGTKDIMIRALSPYTCGNGQANVIDTAIMYIFDSLYVNIPTPPVTVCPNTEVTITADIDSTLDYMWTPAALIPDPLPLGLTVHPRPTVTTAYSITVSQPGAPATCPSVKRTYIANVEPLPRIQLPTRDSTVCLGDSVDISIFSLPTGVNYQYNWSPSTYLRDATSANNKFFAPVGDYKYVITATTPIAGCSSQDSFMMHVVPPFEFESVTPTDTTIRYGDQIQLNSESEAIYWLWTPITYLSDPISKFPYARPLKSTQYTLVGINQYGCKDSALVNIKVEYMPNSGMPNAFSPNGDGLNDVFRIENLRFDKLTEFRVFNRYGQMVFETLNPEKGWDGTFNDKPAATDVYYYQVRLTLPDGTERAFKGDVTLIR
jgi:gliding motility-associated-like protein